MDGEHVKSVTGQNAQGVSEEQAAGKSLAPAGWKACATEGVGATKAPYVGGPMRNGFFCPELLAPAGDWDCAKAAVENGADAIYFGLERFNARMRAQNFTEADLPKLMEYLHRRGVRGYVTFNTLVFANELAEAEQYIRALISAGVDAALVQDVGICRLIRNISPDFPIHASTQMTISSATGVDFARELGCNLVVLARECSIKDLAQITGANGDPAHDVRLTTLPIEVFVHGALCVAYSGQCLTSESLGGRSANRGECAQACRMPFTLVCDGKHVPLGDRQYLLSPQDLAAMEALPGLIRAGVSSLKIEGRLKSAEYVANITRVYRHALDRVFSVISEEKDSSQADRLAAQITKEAQYDMEMAFSRGLHTGWLRGMDHKKLVHGRFGKKRGVYLGTVDRIERDRVFMHLQAELKPGDGVVFDAGHPDQKEEGGRVYSVAPAGRISVLGFGRGDLDYARVHPGDKVWKTSDPELDRRLRQTFAGEAPKYVRPVDIEVRGSRGTPLSLEFNDRIGNVVRLESSIVLSEAQKQPLTTERLREQFGRLGGTPFEVGEFRNLLEGAVILPISEMNRLRRETVAQLETLRRRPRRWRVSDFSLNTWKPAPADNASRQSWPNLIVLVRSMSQLDAVLESAEVTTVYCDFEDQKKYREAVLRFRESAAGLRSPTSGREDLRKDSRFESPSVNDHRSATSSPSPPQRSVEERARGEEVLGKANRSIFVAPPRIFKPGEEWVLKQVRSCDADGYLVRNYDHLRFFQADRKIADFSFNIANALTAEYFKTEFGLERLTASYDLNIEQLDSLLRSAPPDWFEVTVHQQMPMFHMDHCVFCAFLSQGTDYTNCGRPCDRHEVKLRDRVGIEHALKADAGCRNTLYNGRAQTGAEHVIRLVSLGVRQFRVELVNQSAAQTKEIVAAYSALLKGEMSGNDLWRKLKLQNRLGVTRGPMEAPGPTL